MGIFGQYTSMYNNLVGVLSYADLPVSVSNSLATSECESSHTETSNVNLLTNSNSVAV